MVLENLLGNAWKYSARNPQARLQFNCETQRGRQVFNVIDNGAGFDMRNADRLFGVFHACTAPTISPAPASVWRP